jgi:DNA polymerase-3 subunit alpha
MLEIHEDAVDAAVSIKRNEANGQVDLFGDVFDDLDTVADRVPDRPEWGKQDKLAFEREMLGLYVSDHPLAGLELELAKHATHQIQDLAETCEDGDTVILAGLVTSVQHRVARNSGNPYGIFALQDFGGELEVMVLGKSYTEFRHALQADQVVVVRGRVRTRDDGFTIHANSIDTPDVQPVDETRPLELRIPERRASMTAMRELRGLLERHAGPTDVRLALERPDIERVFALPQQVRVSSDLFGELKSLLGPASIA